MIRRRHQTLAAGGRAEDFAGCAVIISHDRMFLDRLATHMLAYEGISAHFEWFEGNFADYEAQIRRLGPDSVNPKKVTYKSGWRGSIGHVSRARPCRRLNGGSICAIGSDCSGSVSGRDNRRLSRVTEFSSLRGPEAS